MKIQHLRWSLIGLIVFLFLLALVFPGERKQIGLSSEWVDGGYRFAGGTDPAALGIAVLMITAYILIHTGWKCLSCWHSGSW